MVVSLQALYMPDLGSTFGSSGTKAAEPTITQRPLSVNREDSPHSFLNCSLHGDTLSVYCSLKILPTKTSFLSRRLTSVSSPPRNSPSVPSVSAAAGPWQLQISSEVWSALNPMNFYSTFTAPASHNQASLLSSVSPMGSTRQPPASGCCQLSGTMSQSCWIFTIHF